MQKKKLTYIIPSLGIGGAEVALLSAIPELNRIFNFKLICFHINPDFIVGLSDQDRDNIICFSGFPFNYIRSFCYILKFRPDIVISSLWKAAILAVLVKVCRRKTKYIEFIHSSTFFHSFDKLFTKFAIKHSDDVFCDSDSAEKFVEEQGFKKKIKVISFLRFQSPQQWQPKPYISLKALYVGRFDKNKRIDRLVLLVKKLVDSGLHFSVDLYGRDGGTMEQSKTLIKENQLEQHIFIKDEIASDKVQGLFSIYDFYFQTSDVEGMAMSVVEAMQHGLICVITNVGEIRNYAKNGKNAVVISDDFNIMETAEQLKDIVNDINRANKISQNAYLTFVGQKKFVNSLIDNLI